MSRSRENLQNIKLNPLIFATPPTAICIMGERGRSPETSTVWWLDRPIYVLRVLVIYNIISKSLVVSDMRSEIFPSFGPMRDPSYRHRTVPSAQLMGR